MKQPTRVLAGLDFQFLPRLSILDRDAHAGLTDPVAKLGGQIALDPLTFQLSEPGEKRADDAYIWADDEGESVKLVADGNGDWVALYTQGTWTVV